MPVLYLSTAADDHKIKKLKEKKVRGQCTIFPGSLGRTCFQSKPHMKMNNHERK